MHNCFGYKVLNIFSDNVIVWSQKQFGDRDFNSFRLWTALRWPQDRRGLQEPKHIKKIYPQNVPISDHTDDKHASHTYLSQKDHREGLLHVVNWFTMCFNCCILFHWHTAITSPKNGWDPPTWSTSVSWKEISYSRNLIIFDSQ